MLRTRPEFLSQAELELIHEHSLRLLREVGLVMPLDEALEIFRQHGARVEGKRVYLPEALVTQALQTAPAEFTVRAREPRFDVRIGGDRSVFVPGYGAPFVTEIDGATRLATLQDYENLTRLADALPSLDMSGHMLVEPSDIPAATAYLQMLRTSMVNSAKPFMGSTEGKHGACASLEMAGILFGDQASLRAQPVMVALINTLSPLGFSQEMAEALVEYARGRQPMVIAALAQAGASGPVTLAGTLAMQNAELLAGIVLAQLVSPGTPVIYGSTSTAIDMGTGGLSIGCPELSIFIVCTAQLARYYGLPSRAGGTLTDAHLLDAQAGSEGTMAMMTSVMSGINFVLHAGGILSSYLSFSYEKLIMDDDICGALRRFMQGMELTEESLAFEAVERVGPGGNFLTEAQTLERCRTEFYRSRLANRRGINDWQRRGRKGIQEVARERWQALLAKHVAPAPDALTVAQLDRYIEQHA